MNEATTTLTRADTSRSNIKRPGVVAEGSGTNGIGSYGGGRGTAKEAGMGNKPLFEKDKETGKAKTVNQPIITKDVDNLAPARKELQTAEGNTAMGDVSITKGTAKKPAAGAVGPAIAPVNASRPNKPRADANATEANSALQGVSTTR